MTLPDPFQVPDQTEPDLTELVGYGPAAEYLGIKRNTLSSYVARGIGPVPLPEARACGQYNLPVFTHAELDRWAADRPGQGARTDLTPEADTELATTTA